MNKKLFLLFVLIIVLIITSKITNTSSPHTQIPIQKAEQNPLEISVMRQKDYPGSDLKIEQTLADGLNYHQYIASYISEGFKILGLLTIPFSGSNFPVIIFNHGYIPPKEYKTTEKYVAYVDVFARNGYVVFKSDYRGHDNSTGKPEGAYYSPAYTIDVLNALSSLKKYKDADPDKIGMWGHSMGGNITLRAMVVSADIKAGVIWAGVVGSYDDLLNNWHNRGADLTPEQKMHVLEIRNSLVRKNSTPSANPKFWDSIDPTKHLSEVSGPIQLHQGLVDQTVPPLFSRHLYEGLKTAGKNVELFTYEGADHNLSDPAFSQAMKRSVDFFDKYLK